MPVFASLPSCYSWADVDSLSMISASKDNKLHAIVRKKGSDDYCPMASKCFQVLRREPGRTLRHLLHSKHRRSRIWRDQQAQTRAVLSRFVTVECDIRAGSRRTSPSLEHGTWKLHQSVATPSWWLRKPPLARSRQGPSNQSSALLVGMRGVVGAWLSGT